MVPISLQIQNFLSYGTGLEPLDFTSFHTACLSGNNGNGKSAILDALTWALWGEARHSTSHLLRLGATEMRVELTFDLNGERYRVLRGWRKKKSGGDPTLELHVLDESGLARALTRPATRETQAQINSLLRMDYDTFIASAYLKQGQADRFTRQPPGERKRVLAEILGLSRYQEIADKARADARLADAKVEQLDSQMESIERFLAGRAEAQRLFDHFTQLLSTLQPKLEATEARLADLRARKIRLEADRKRLDVVSQELVVIERELRDARATRGELQRKKTDIEEWQAQADQIAEDYQKYRDAKDAVDRWQATYEKWRELADAANDAKEKVNAATQAAHAERSGLQSQIEFSQNILAQNEAQLSHADEIIQGYEELKKSREQESEYSKRRAAFDEAQREVQAAREALRDKTLAIESRLHILDSQIADAEKIVANEADAKQRLQQAEAKIAEIEGAQTRLRELEDERNNFDARLQGLKTSVETERANIDSNKQKLRVLLANPQAQCPLCESQLGEHGREHIQANIEDEIALGEERIAEYTAEARMVRGKRDAMDGEIQSCRKLLDASQRLYDNRAIAKRQTDEIEAARERIRVLTSEKTSLQQQYDSGDFAPEESRRLKSAELALQNCDYNPQKHSEVSRHVAELQTWESKHFALESARQQVTDASARSEKLNPQLQELDARIERGDFAPEETARLEQLKIQATRLGYDKNAHRSAREALQNLEKAPQRWERLQAELRNLPDIESRLEATTKQIGEREEKLQNLEAESAKLRDASTQLAACERELSESEFEIQQLRSQERDASTELGRQQKELETCAQQEELRAQIGEERTAKAKEAFILKKTGESFGKDGIQALIIENTIPEIQDEANAILRRLTRSHMQISLESQREKQSGGTRETLDIKISDERGTREYSLFSGGEAFRADFALRIALSKLLARRAGTQLRTLIVDEGFGTQDSEGLRQMIECIVAVAEDFSKVLVVTHIDELKAAFPTRIEVSKSPESGSRYEVLSA